MRTDRDLPRLPDPDPLERELRELPRIPAAPGFTTRLLVRLAERDRPSVGPLWSRDLPRWSWAVAATLLLLAVGLSGLWQRGQERRELRQRLHSLQAEGQTLSTELARLQAREVVYLGSDDRFDFLLDLSSRPPADPRGGEVVPVSAVY